jgi:hypothetical protein
VSEAHCFEYCNIWYLVRVLHEQVFAIVEKHALFDDRLQGSPGFVDVEANLLRKLAWNVGLSSQNCMAEWIFGIDARDVTK